MIQIKRRFGKYQFVLKQSGSGRTKKHKLIRIGKGKAMVSNINATLFKSLCSADTEVWVEIFETKKQTGTLSSKKGCYEG